jgi:hypothetical protein
MQCSNNLKQMGLALHNYESANRTFPPGCISRVTGPWSGVANDPVPEAGPGWSFFAMMLPQLEQSGLYETIDFTRPIIDPVNRAARSTIVKEYQCPSDVGRGPITVWPISLGITDIASTSYIASLGGGNPADAPRYTALHEEQPFNGMFHRNRAIRHADVLDGTSNTIGLGERASMFTPNGWAGVIPTAQTVFSAEVAARRGQVVGATARPAITMAAIHVRSGGPNHPTGSPGGYWSPHTGGCLFLLMDGSTHTISTNIDMPIYRAMAGRNDGIAFTLP